MMEVGTAIVNVKTLNDTDITWLYCLSVVGENEFYTRKFRVSVTRCIVHDMQDFSVLGSRLVLKSS